ncbi:MAG: (2Fe-2S) ferredoxin domain-containing protein [Kiritimatiellia bacterium]|nr:(2Fe-2S) ferredoxin domain-containing protein [Kiritimatiellia bacterium]
MHKPTIRICLGSSCFARGNGRNVEIIEQFLKAHGLKDEVDLNMSGCLCTGRCQDGPIVEIDGTVYDHVSGGAINGLLEKTFATHTNPRA